MLQKGHLWKICLCNVCLNPLCQGGMTIISDYKRHHYSAENLKTREFRKHIMMTINWSQMMLTLRWTLLKFTNDRILSGTCLLVYYIFRKYIKNVWERLRLIFNSNIFLIKYVIKIKPDKLACVCLYYKISVYFRKK